MNGDQLPTVTLGGVPITVINRTEEAELMVRLAARRRDTGPLFFTSANGEVIARTSMDPDLSALFREADQIVADAIAVQVTNSRIQSQVGDGRGAPWVTVSVASAWTTIPGRERCSGTASMSPSSTAVAPT